MACSFASGIRRAVVPPMTPLSSGRVKPSPTSSLTSCSRLAVGLTTAAQAPPSLPPAAPAHVFAYPISAPSRLARTVGLRVAPSGIERRARGRHAERPGPSGKDQVAVAELMPAVPRRQGLSVGALEKRPARDGLEHGEMRSRRLVPARDQAVDDASAARRGHDRVGPTLAGMDPTTDVADRLEGADRRRADGDDSAS